MQNSGSLVTDRLTSKLKPEEVACGFDLGLQLGLQKGRAAATDINFLTVQRRELLSHGEMPQTESQADSACGGVSIQSYGCCFYIFLPQKENIYDLTFAVLVQFQTDAFLASAWP